MSRTTMETYTGQVLDFEDISPDVIHLADIAQALSLTCRFAGHIPRFYSVASHALLVRRLVVELYERPDLALAALHHDSHEAYIGDAPKPLKNTPGEGFSRLAGALDVAIAEKFRIDPLDFADPVVKEADRFALWLEARELKMHGPDGPSFKPWWPWEAVPPEIVATKIDAPQYPAAVSRTFIRRHVQFREPAYV